MILAFDPVDAPKPASAYSQGVVYEGPARRLIISGQVGVDLQGRIVEGFEAQVRQAFANLEAVLRAAEMGITDLVKLTVFVTRSDVIGQWRDLRDSALQGHKPASTYLQVAGLAHPDFLVEIEAEAVQEAS